MRYDEDFFLWTEEQALLLRKAAAIRPNSLPDLDWHNLAQEIEGLGRSQLREVRARYRVLLLHLLKWQHQPNLRSGSWRAAIRDQRDEIRDLLETSPGLQSHRDEQCAKAYERARKAAAEETGLALATFPKACPYSSSDAEDDRFWPGPLRPEPDRLY